MIGQEQAAVQEGAKRNQSQEQEREVKFRVKVGVHQKTVGKGTAKESKTLHTASTPTAVFAEKVSVIKRLDPYGDKFEQVVSQ